MEGVNWIHLTKDTDKCWVFVNMVTNCQVTWNAWYFSTTRDRRTFPYRTVFHRIRWLMAIFTFHTICFFLQKKREREREKQMKKKN